jgi:hypothetical protein
MRRWCQRPNKPESDPSDWEVFDREAVDALRERSPQQYGLLLRNVSSVTEAIIRSERNYPTARQLYDELREPLICRTTFGRLLTIFADLGMIAIFAERGGANRYDLTDVSVEQLRRLEQVLTETDEKNREDRPISGPQLPARVNFERE